MPCLLIAGVGAVVLHCPCSDDDGRDCLNRESAVENAVRIHVRRSTGDNGKVRDLPVCGQGTTFKWITNLYTKEQRYEDLGAQVRPLEDIADSTRMRMST